MTAETYDDAHLEQSTQSLEGLRRKRLQLVAQTVAKNAGVGESRMQHVIDAETALDVNSDPVILKERYGWSSARVRKALSIAAAYQTELSSGSFGAGDTAASWAPVPLTAPLNDQLRHGADPTGEKATILPKPIQNLFGNILDDDQMTRLAGFSDIQIDFIALEVGKLLHEHAQGQRLINRHVSYIRQLMKGVPLRELAAKDKIRPEAIYPIFLNRLPKILEPHKDNILNAFEAISQLPADTEGPREEDLVFEVRETELKERTPRVQNKKEPSVSLEKRTKKPRTEPSEKIIKDEDDESFHALDSVGFYLKQTGKVALLSAAEEVELAKDIEAGLYAERKLAWLEGERIEIFKGKHTTVYDDGYKRDLGRMVARGNQAKNHMLEANLRLVVSLAKRYTGRGMAFQDLIQEGNLGLIRAMEKFDYTKGFKFSTYATWWIRQAITRGMADQGRTIRLPVHFVEKVNKLSRIKREMYQNLGREATYEELAAESGIPVDKIEEFLEFSRDPVSLDMPVGTDEEAPLGDFIEDQEGINPLDAAELADKEVTIARVIATLDEREQEIVRLRFGFHDGTPLTLDQIGKLYGISRERVRQIERDVMKKLRSGERAEKLKAVNE